jgi:hypothetical protein
VEIVKGRLGEGEKGRNGEGEKGGRGDSVELCETQCNSVVNRFLSIIICSILHNFIIYDY